MLVGVLFLKFEFIVVLGGAFQSVCTGSPRRSIGQSIIIVTLILIAAVVSVAK